MLGDHPAQCGILVRLEVLRLGLLASGHAAVAAGWGALCAACADLTLMCPRCADASAKSAENKMIFQKKKKKVHRQSAALGKCVKLVCNLGKLASVAAPVASVTVRGIAHVGIIIMIVNNASRLMAPCEGGEDWLRSSGRALDMVMRDGLNN